MSEDISELKPNKPNIITSGVIDVVGFYDKMEPKEIIHELLDGEYVLVEDYYYNGLQILKELKSYLQRKYNRNTYRGEREYRKAYRDASSKLLLLVIDHELDVLKSPKIGWFEILFPKHDQFLISFPEAQGLNSSWQWYKNGIEIETLGLVIHPYYGIYFPTRFTHLELLDRWLKRYTGPQENAIDIGVGSGVLSFQLIQHGFSHVVATDTNKNAIISTAKDSKRLEFDDHLDLRHGDLFAEYGGNFDLIVFNPPWIKVERELEEGIDTAMYYNSGLFKRFFDQAKEYLRDDGTLVLLFSNFGNVIAEDSIHPIKHELETHDRFHQDQYLTKKPKSASEKTDRSDRRKDEKVELWVLTHK